MVGLMMVGLVLKENRGYQYQDSLHVIDSCLSTVRALINLSTERSCRSSQVRATKAGILEDWRATDTRYAVFISRKIPIDVNADHIIQHSRQHWRVFGVSCSDQQNTRRSCTGDEGL